MERSGHQVLAVENQPSEVPFGFTFSFDEDFTLKLRFSIDLLPYLQKGSKRVQPKDPKVSKGAKRVQKGPKRPKKVGKGPRGSKRVTSVKRGPNLCYVSKIVKKCPQCPKCPKY